MKKSRYQLGNFRSFRVSPRSKKERKKEVRGPRESKPSLGRAASTQASEEITAYSPAMIIDDAAAAAAAAQVAEGETSPLVKPPRPGLGTPTSTTKGGE